MSLPVRTRRRWRQDPAGRRERILAAAEEEIARVGVHGLRTQSVARRAGVSDGTVFHSFGSKRALLVEVGRRYGERLARAAFDGSLAPGKDPDVAAIIGGIFDYVARNRALFTAFLWANDPTVGAAASALREEMVSAIARQLSEGVAGGWLPSMDPRVAAEIQYAMVEGTARDCFVRNEGRERERTERELVRSLRALLGQVEPTAPPLG